MYELLRETIFGRIIHLVSQGKLFSYEEQRDPSRLQRYIATESAPASETPTETSPHSLDHQEADPEKGSDVQLVDWVENDSEVSNPFGAPCSRYQIVLTYTSIPETGRV